jgi:hypothetical protein
MFVKPRDKSNAITKTLKVFSKRKNKTALYSWGRALAFPFKLY